LARPTGIEPKTIQDADEWNGGDMIDISKLKKADE
jgi:hypothetical protein